MCTSWNGQTLLELLIGNFNLDCLAFGHTEQFSCTLALHLPLTTSTSFMIDMEGCPSLICHSLYFSGMVSTTAAIPTIVRHYFIDFYWLHVPPENVQSTMFLINPPHIATGEVLKHTEVRKERYTAREVLGYPRNWHKIESKVRHI